ncbi:hypothetical protein OAN72_00600 [bacterium]|nr:hypothetical protein [bacterium]
MSDTQATKGSSLLTFLGSLGGILIFFLIIWIAYLPNRPEPVNALATADRQAKADEARAAGIAKVTTTEVIDADLGTVRIPVDQAMKLLVEDYDGLVKITQPEIVTEPVQEATKEASIESE